MKHERIRPILKVKDGQGWVQKDGATPTGHIRES